MIEKRIATYSEYEELKLSLVSDKPYIRHIKSLSVEPISQDLCELKIEYYDNTYEDPQFEIRG